MRWMVFAVGACVALLSGCGDEGHTATESDIFNAYFYFPGDSPREVYLGRVTGISACQSAASSYASQHHMNRSDRWSYICCREAHGSSCYDKHR